MKTLSTITALLIILVSSQSYGQAVTKDSLRALNEQKQNIEISKKLNERKTELAKLENELAEKSEQLEKATTEAQNAANENQEFANKLKNNPQSKDLGNQASKAARQAERNTKAARKLNDNVEKIKADIADLKNKISEDEAKSGAASTGISSSVQKQEEKPAMVSGQVSGRNFATDTAVLKQTTQPVAEKIIESTYRNYPQQSTQPTIIINNIVIASDNERQKPAVAPVEAGNNLRNMPDYEEFKAWQNQRGAGRGRNMPARQNDFSRSDSGIDTEQSEDLQESRDRLTFKERFGEKPARNSGLWVIPVVGIHASNFKADIKEGEADGRTGWNAGLDFRMHTRRFFVQPGAHYFSSSMQYTSEDSISNAPLLTGPRIHSLKVPVLLGLYLTKANKGFFKMNVKAGATGTYVLTVDKSDLAQFNKSNIEEFSYGLNAGLGLEFGFLTLDITHEWGMSRLFKENNQKNNLLRATIGFKL